MRKIVYVFLGVILILLAGCKEETGYPEITEPHITTWMMDFLVTETGYKDFGSLFVEELSDDVIQDTYELVNEVRGDSASSVSKTLSFIRYENGPSLLVALYYDSETGKYLIYDVKEVPKEVEAFLKDIGE